MNEVENGEYYTVKGFIIGTVLLVLLGVLNLLEYSGLDM
jgi:hypothetical protein